ncbi:MAG: GTP cyclohydrolase I FolE [Kiritimatiellae bacterium]|nr:GTP cyclohydrolase I FolE [Kiritimatiellia bacterium]
MKRQKGEVEALTAAKGKEPDQKRIASLVKELLLELGEDPGREGLKKTPERVAKSLAYLTRGYRQNVKAVVNGAYFASGTNHMVILKDIELYSMCEHHMLPFFGKAAIGYISRGKVLGVSKIARIVDMFARRLQIQERMTEEIAQAIMDESGAEGVGVVIKAKHLCMMMRGVEKQNSEMVTSAVLGSFRSDAKVREEFLSLVK